MSTIASSAARILREADIRGYLDGVLLVVGTTALAAYELEAGERFAQGMDSTEDFDLAWSAREKESVVLATREPLNLLGMLKAVDATYTVNTERTFQARNRDAYEVELLIAPSRVTGMPRSVGLAPIPLPEQEWLLMGRPIDHVVCGLDKSPARIVAPDPRWFALHKLWMADKVERNPLKKPKDRNQGQALLKAVARCMPQYPLDERFKMELPRELAPYLEAWLNSPEGQLSGNSRPF